MGMIALNIYMGLTRDNLPYYLYNFSTMRTRLIILRALARSSMHMFTVKDQTRSYREAKDPKYASETKGRAVVVKALPTATTEVPSLVVSSIVQKPKSGSGTVSAEIRMEDTTTLLDPGDVNTRNRYDVVKIEWSTRPKADVDYSYRQAMLEALVAHVTADDCKVMRELDENMPLETF